MYENDTESSCLKFDHTFVHTSSFLLVRDVKKKFHLGFHQNIRIQMQFSMLFITTLLSIEFKGSKWARLLLCHYVVKKAALTCSIDLSSTTYRKSERESSIRNNVRSFVRPFILYSH